MTTSPLLRLQVGSPASAHVDWEEHIQFYKSGEYQKHGIHRQAGPPHRRVQLKLVEPESQIQQE